MQPEATARLAANRAEIDALRFYFSVPHANRPGYDEVKGLARALRDAPAHFTTDRLWRCYERVRPERFRPLRRADQLADVVSLVRFYDLRTNKHFTLRQSSLTRADLAEFVAAYLPKRSRADRRGTWDTAADGGKGAPVAGTSGRWRSYTYEELIARDKVSLDLFWLRDESLEDSANLPEPHVLAQEIADDLRAALEQIEEVLEDLPRGHDVR